MEYGECMKYLKKRRFNGIFASLFLLICCSLTSCFSFEYHQYINEFEIETEEGAIERLSEWEIDVPDSINVIYKHYEKPEGWDGGWWKVYYIFCIIGDFSFETEKTSADIESFKKEWDKLSLASANWPEKVETWPDFNSEMQCLIAVRFKETINSSEDNGVSSKDIYTIKNLKEDKYYYRRQSVGNSIFVGKGYYLVQADQYGSTLLFCSLTIDSLEVKRYRVD